MFLSFFLRIIGFLSGISCDSCVKVLQQLKNRRENGAATPVLAHIASWGEETGQLKKFDVLHCACHHSFRASVHFDFGSSRLCLSSRRFSLAALWFGHMVQPQPSAFLPRRAPLTNESDWLRLCVIGWAAFLVTLLVLLMAIREWKELKERLGSQVSRMWRLAKSGAMLERAWVQDSQESLEKLCSRQELLENVRAALECGQTFVIDPGMVATSFEKDMLRACEKTLYNRMEITPQPWMESSQNNALFAVRTFGGLVWRWLTPTLVELISCGSCGCSAGATLVQAMQQKVAAQGARFLILKALSDSEDFWTKQGFEHFTAGGALTWWPSCPEADQAAVLGFYEHSSPKTFVMRLPSMQEDAV